MIYSIIFFAVFGALVAAFSILATVIFYHIARFSFIGDWSKRVFLVNMVVCALIVVGSLVLMIINHIFS